MCYLFIKTILIIYSIRQLRRWVNNGNFNYDVVTYYCNKFKNWVRYSSKRLNTGAT